MEYQFRSAYWLRATLPALLLFAMAIVATIPPASASEPIDDLRGHPQRTTPSPVRLSAVEPEIMEPVARQRTLPPPNLRQPEPRVDKPKSTARPVIIVIGGDLGLGGSDQPISPLGAYRHGTRHPWADVTRHIKPLLIGDLNFANLETVVTDRKSLSPAEKRFRFRSHPEGVRHLLRTGFNAFSLANNHAIDFGTAGIRDTLHHIRRFEGFGLKLWSGLGTSAEAFEPGRISIRGARIRMTAVGIGGVSPTSTRVGMPGYRSSRDFDKALDTLAATPADYRIFSAHYGQELQVRPSTGAVQKFRDRAVNANGIDLVIGHHAHTVAGIQSIGGKLIFYGMGNLLHPGMQNMARFNRCRDYGLIARIHLTPNREGRLTARAVEVIPITDMHLMAKPMPASAAARRIEVLNYLATGLDDVASRASGVRFQTRDNGTGLYCTQHAKLADGPLGALCRNWTPPDPVKASDLRNLRYACGGSALIARKKPSKKSRARAKSSNRGRKYTSRRKRFAARALRPVD